MIFLSRVKFKRLNDLAKAPTKGSMFAAGWDLYAATSYDITIPPHENVKIGTGIAVALPEGLYGAICARSGMASKQELKPANCVGVIDSDYRGELIVALHNDSNDPQVVPAGARIAQFILTPFFDVIWDEVFGDLPETERGEGGFGSTGTK